jgi:hypothetical protein
MEEQKIQDLLKQAEEQKNSIEIEPLLDVVRKLTEERKVIYEALSRLQGRSTELCMECRRLKAEAEQFQTEWEEERQAFKLRNEQLREELSYHRLNALKRSE